MTSVSNSFIGLLTDASTTGEWENVTGYSTVCINISVPDTATTYFSTEVHLEWALPDLPGTPYTMHKNIITGEQITVQVGETRFFQLPILANLFRVIINYEQTSVIPAETIIATLFKDSTSRVILEGGSFHPFDRPAVLIAPDDLTSATCIKSVLTDSSGFYNPSVTNNPFIFFNSMYVHPDISDNNGTLIVSIPVESNEGTNGKHTMLTSLSNTVGEAPATTVSGGFFYSLADACGYMISTTKTGHLRGLNGLNAALTSNGDCYDISGYNPLWIEFTNVIRVVNKELDVSLPGLEARNYLVTTDDLCSNNIGLRSIGISNLTATVMWIKVYDMNGTDAVTLNDTELESRVKLNIPVPANQSRDINMGKGVHFAKGIHFRLTDNYIYSATPVSTGQVILSGSYRLVNVINQ